MAKKKIRPYGQILLDMEVLRNEMLDDHDVQWSDMIFELYAWLEVHRPDAREEYMDGTNPILRYSHVINLKNG